MSDENKDFDGIRYRAETSSPVIFRILFASLALWAICFMAYYLFNGWSSEAEFSQKMQVKAEKLAAGRSAEVKAPAAEARQEVKQIDYIALGKKEFAEQCAACHGADAKGGIGPDLTLKGFKYGKTDQAVKKTISEGRAGGMPAFKSHLSDEKLEGLVKFILSL